MPLPRRMIRVACEDESDALVQSLRLGVFDDAQRDSARSDATPRVSTIEPVMPADTIALPRYTTMQAEAQRDEEPEGEDDNDEDEAAILAAPGGQLDTGCFKLVLVGPDGTHAATWNQCRDGPHDVADAFVAIDDDSRLRFIAALQEAANALGCTDADAVANPAATAEGKKKRHRRAQKSQRSNKSERTRRDRCRSPSPSSAASDADEPARGADAGTKEEDEAEELEIEVIRIPTTVKAVHSPPRAAMHYGDAADDDAADDDGHAAYDGFDVPPPQEEREPSARGSVGSVDSDFALLVGPTQASQRPAAAARHAVVGATRTFTREAVFGDGEVSLLPPRASVVARLRRGEPASPVSSSTARGSSTMPGGDVIAFCDMPEVALRAMTAVQLRDLLRPFKLPLSGNKGALIERIADAQATFAREMANTTADAAVDIGRLSAAMPAAGGRASSPAASLLPRRSVGSKSARIDGASFPDDDAAGFARSSNDDAVSQRRPDQPRPSAPISASPSSSAGGAAAVRSPVESAAKSIYSAATRLGSWLGSAVKRASAGPRASTGSHAQRPAGAAVMTYDAEFEERRAAEVELFGAASSSSSGGLGLRARSEDESNRRASSKGGMLSPVRGSESRLSTA